MKNLEEIIISNLDKKKYNLDKKMSFINKLSINFYPIKKKVYLAFINEYIGKDNINLILEEINNLHNKDNAKKWCSYIVIANTDYTFHKEELFYFNGVNIFANFLLFNNKINEIYYYNKWIFPLGLNFKYAVKDIKKILEN